MRSIVSQRQAEGSVLVIALFMILVLTVLGMTATTNSRIERMIATNDRLHKETFATAEHALVLGEATLEQLLAQADFAAASIDGHWDVGQQPAWEALRWDASDSLDTQSFFNDPNNPHDNHLPVPPPSMVAGMPLPRYMIEARQFKRDSLTIGMGESTGVWTFNVSAHGTNTNKTSNVILQSVYAKRYN